MAINKVLVKKIQRLSQKYYDDLQRIYDDEMDLETYENSPAVEASVIAQGEAEATVNADIEWD
ncbi:MAG: hypothetical protein E3J60_04715 [Dehalococcoidia bacterium]|nr:MAG: hypothetical protein E3J60_04715 [Dehalococcoidia bacterium]